jgi:hypothetical protein
VLAEEKLDEICAALEQSTQQIPYMPWREDWVLKFQVSSFKFTACSKKNFSM